MEPASELEELKEMAEIAVFHNKKQGSRWWKQECSRIRQKWQRKRQLEAGGGGGDQPPASRSRTEFDWVTDTHYGVKLAASDWEQAFEKMKVHHEDASDWKADAPSQGKCKLEGEEYVFKRYKAAWKEDWSNPFRVRIVLKDKDVYIAQVCVVGRVARAWWVTTSRCPGRWVVSGRRRR